MTVRAGRWSWAPSGSHDVEQGQGHRLDTTADGGLGVGAKLGAQAGS